MKYGFISNTLSSFVSFFNILQAADSTPELAIFVDKQNLGITASGFTTPKQNPNWVSKATGYAHKHGKTLLAALSITATMAGTEVKAQTSATIDPDYYSMDNPFHVRTLPDRSSINIKIKTGKATPITMDDLASGQSIQIQNANGELLPNNDVITLDKPGIRSWDYKDKEGNIKLITIVVNYEVDLFDRTQNSLTENMRPDIIRADQATLSAGPNMKNHKWTNLSTNTVIGQGKTDSTKVAGKGTYELRGVDGTGLATGNSRDTIAVLQKPVFNKATRKYDFPSTEKNITYRLYKYDLNGSETIADSTRTMVETFVGDGNPHKSIPLSDSSIYRISAQRTAATDEDTHLPSQHTSFETGITDISFVTLPFKILNHKIVLLYETYFELYSITGSKLLAGKALQFNTPIQAGIYLLVIDNKAYKINITS